MKKKNIHKSKKKIYKIALIKVIYCNTQRYQQVFYKNIDTQTKKYTKANIYDIAMDSGAMSKCVSFTIIGIHKEKQITKAKIYDCDCVHMDCDKVSGSADSLAPWEVTTGPTKS